MLCLTRRVGERIVIDGNIIVQVTRVAGEKVTLGIVAPSDVPVHRQETQDKIDRERGDGPLLRAG